MSNLRPGDILDNTYEIIKEIGAGGGGIVYLARHNRLQIDVVVKKIREEVKGKVENRKEVDILKSLKNDYLPIVYDFIEREDGVYTVMEYIRGENLEDALKKHGPFEQKDVQKWAEQLGEALKCLHSQETPIIHSDIKPANIMLTEAGNVCLIDFNISLAMNGIQGAAVGVSAEFSPLEQYRDITVYTNVTRSYTLQRSMHATLDGEQKKTSVQQDEERTVLLHEAEGSGTVLLEEDKTVLLEEAGEGFQRFGEDSELIKYIGLGIDTRSDIYSLGMTLYCLMAGREIEPDLRKRLPIEKTGAKISDGFASIINKMIAIPREERYQDGVEYLYAIKNCYKLEREYIAAQRKKRMITGTLIASAIAVALFVFGFSYMLRMKKNNQYVETISSAHQAGEAGAYQEAQAYIAKAKEIEETRITAYEEEVYLSYLKEDYDTCISVGEGHLNGPVFLVKNDADYSSMGNIAYLVANAYFGKDDYLNARRYLEAAIGYSDKNPLYYRDYAITLGKLGLLEEAQMQLENAISMDLSEDSIYLAQGEIHHVKGEYEKALASFEQVLHMSTDIQLRRRTVLLTVDVYKNIGGSAVVDEVALLETYQAQAGAGNHFSVTSALADAYLRMAAYDTAKAEVCYEKALDLFNSMYSSGYMTWQMQENLVILYENLNRFEEAEELLMQMKEQQPDNYRVYMRLAYLEADKQQQKENADRDYMPMAAWYEEAMSHYEEDEQDLEMQMLTSMIADLKDKDWM